MNIIFRNIISFLAGLAFFLLPSQVTWPFGQKEGKNLSKNGKNGRD